jgi:hypothetical protein
MDSKTIILQLTPQHSVVWLNHDKDTATIIGIVHWRERNKWRAVHHPLLVFHIVKKKRAGMYVSKGKACGSSLLCCSGWILAKQQCRTNVDTDRYLCQTTVHYQCGHSTCAKQQCITNVDTVLVPNNSALPMWTGISTCAKQQCITNVDMDTR